MAVNIFGLGMQAFDQGYDRTQAIRDQVTRRKAGQRLAVGDRTGASQAFASEGMIPEARQMQADQFAVEDRQAGQAKEQQAEAAKRAELLIGAAGALKRLPPEQRRSALSHPIFQMAGLSQDQLAGLTDEDLSDQSLDMFVGEVEKAAQQFTLGPGMKRFDEKGNLIAEAPFAPQYRTVSEGGTLVEVAPDGTSRPIMSKPKTYAPARSGGGRSSSVPKPPAGFILDP